MVDKTKKGNQGLTFDALADGLDFDELDEEKIRQEQGYEKGNAQANRLSVREVNGIKLVSKDNKDITDLAFANHVKALCGDFNQTAVKNQNLQQSK